MLDGAVLDEGWLREDGFHDEGMRRSLLLQNGGGAIPLEAPEVSGAGLCTRPVTIGPAAAKSTRPEARQPR